MTTTYTLRDGGRIAATSPADFLHQLHVSSFFDNEGTDEEYMQRFAHRLKQLDGSIVRTDTVYKIIKSIKINTFLWNLFGKWYCFYYLCIIKH